uniref:Putative structural protein n=1 Tax=viral metagenome TaxID=1070528 RepID=A0A6M3JJJ6_9ZZZZ
MRIVKVKWVDSNIIHGWQSNIDDCDVALSDEVGFLVKENEETIILARGVSQYGLLNSPMAIPKGCIKSIKEMRLK